MILVSAIAVLAAACTPQTRPETPSGDDPRFACNAERLTPMVGQTATRELGIEAQRLSDARTIRWIRPGTMVTMDYRTDRLNIHVDEQNRVTRFACG